MVQELANTELPMPVQRYFDLVLPEGGFFRTSPKNDWMKIRGKQFFRTDIPEFEWVGKTTMFKAIDSYVGGFPSRTYPIHLPYLN